MTWRERVHVAICAAKGLVYLHEDCNPPVIHKDVKPTNILLDHKFHAKIANFGPNATHMLTGATGTPGYVDPSYSCVAEVGPSCDIHSFGVVLLQLVTGKPACDSLRDEAAYHITDWVSFPFSFCSSLFEFIPQTHSYHLWFQRMNPYQRLSMHCHIRLNFPFFSTGSGKVRVRRVGRNT